MNRLGLACLAFLGLFVPYVRCQGMSPMSMMLGMGGGEMMGGGGMRDMMLMSALMGGMRGGSGGGAGRSPGSSPDLATMMLLSQQGGGMGNMQDMLPMLAMMGNGGGQTPATPVAVTSPMGGATVGTGTPGATSMAVGMAQMLGNSGSAITPAQQESLWRIAQAAGQTQNIMEAVSSQSDRLYLEKNGVSGVSPMMRVMVCPRQTSCQFVFCGSERPLMLYTPESFYLCQGCPSCPMDTSARRMQNMMQIMSARAGGMAGAPGATSPSAPSPMPMPMPTGPMPMPTGPMPMPTGPMPMPTGPMPMPALPMPPTGAMPRGRMPPGMSAAMFEMMKQQMAQQGSVAPSAGPRGMPPMPQGMPQYPPMGSQYPVAPPAGNTPQYPPRRHGPPPRSQGPPPQSPSQAERTMPAGAPPAQFVQAVEKMGRRLQRRNRNDPRNTGPAPQQQMGPP